MPPRIIGLYPRDLFGPAQQDGLKKGVAHYCSGRDVGVIDLNELSYSDLKDRNINSLKSRLGEILARENVLKGKLIFTRYESSGEWNVVNPEKLLSQI